VGVAAVGCRRARSCFHRAESRSSSVADTPDMGVADLRPNPLENESRSVVGLLESAVICGEGVNKAKAKPNIASEGEPYAMEADDE
jgi:hypothetical protein